MSRFPHSRLLKRNSQASASALTNDMVSATLLKTRNALELTVQGTLQEQQYKALSATRVLHSIFVCPHGERSDSTKNHTRWHDTDFGKTRVPHSVFVCPHGEHSMLVFNEEPDKMIQQLPLIKQFTLYPNLQWGTIRDSACLKKLFSTRTIGNGIATDFDETLY